MAATPQGDENNKNVNNPKRKMALLEADGLESSPADAGGNANSLHHLQLANSAGWYAHFDHEEGAIELGRSTMMQLGGPSTDMLLATSTAAAAQWQQKPR
jgi:hypothetical protein